MIVQFVGAARASDMNVNIGRSETFKVGVKPSTTKKNVRYVPKVQLLFN